MDNLVCARCGADTSEDVFAGQVATLDGVYRLCGQCFPEWQKEAKNIPIKRRRDPVKFDARETRGTKVRTYRGILATDPLHSNGLVDLGDGLFGGKYNLLELALEAGVDMPQVLDGQVRVIVTIVYPQEAQE